MLISINPNTLVIKKESLTENEQNYLNEYLKNLKQSIIVRDYDSSYQITSNEQRNLYTILLDITRKYDIELI